MKTRLFAAALALGATMTISACSDNSEDATVTQSRLNDIDNIEGTINDDMINTDTVENSDSNNESAPTEASTGNNNGNSDNPAGNEDDGNEGSGGGG